MPITRQDEIEFFDSGSVTLLQNQHMFLALRNFFNKLLPVSFKYYLVKKLPNVETFLASSLRGVDQLWKKDAAFITAYDAVAERSLLDNRKAYTLYLCAQKSASNEGEFAEFGVFRGAGSKLMLVASRHAKKILLFDTFEGLPNVSMEHDKHWKEGDLGEIDLTEIKSFLSEDNFEFHVGFFPESAADVSPAIKFSFVHIDFDLYQSTLDALAYCYNRMSPAGLILIDDYGVLACPGVKKAVDEFFAKKPEMVLPNFNGQCIIVKS